jgi:hypothetical protein
VRNLKIAAAVAAGLLAASSGAFALHLVQKYERAVALTQWRAPWADVYLSADEVKNLADSEKPGAQFYLFKANVFDQFDSPDTYGCLDHHEG